MSVKIINGLKSFEQASELYEDYKKSVTNNSEDFGALSWCCYYYQQSVELMLKGIIENFGIEPKRGHQLDPILLFIRNEIPESKEKIQLVEILNYMDDKKLPYIMSSWEAESRYDGIQEVNTKDIEESEIVCNKLKEFIELNKIR